MVIINEQLLNNMWFCDFILTCIFFRYKIDYISAESAFLFNIKFSACFESKGDCMLNIPILKDVKIPILACNFSLQQFAIPG